MIKFNRNERIVDPKTLGRSVLKPALYDPPPVPSPPARSTEAARTTEPPRASAPLGPPPTLTNPAATPAVAASPRSAAPPATAPATTSATEPPGSKLLVGVNIKLKGVEINDCDTLVIEGQVEATVHSRAMEIAPPGTLLGTATIEIAEVHGTFSGELTARTRLVVHGTGRVSGTIRYGELVVHQGGELNGDVAHFDAAEGAARAARASAPGTPSGPSAQGGHASH